ncbi:MAG: Dephospho-CoA kinase-like protein [Microgenomates group bacterium GW2011_GWC1_39_7b]|uniref:Dephospho-CoA kinase-like protein n=3 Tax=Candidatus Woeseibacteriota TaxID=1752722 RepID=A0A0G0UUX4_9BACT|nr:MAG: Dephospho-CoA kinase-like protein [Candidatus Woesebacteria bacterium GW2011_GWB1_39_10]KKR26679.1 MAG: Dephospho-CoA kinase-like protein [Microgenomates group bacterium GW2011_GWC1_39_7b]KKR74186.1 MAG: Dephospho-CoA kinase-like protein [Candidatus Woesebacteria bacterium GW2011_GWA2_40_7]KKR92483.1 MAG: Dephospho-CoA kinase-like protein [Candidatus Woesebacteria bacterium GW2011_GWA1_41_13b]
MKELLCITGLTGSGKSVASDFFVDKGYQYVRFGQIVLDEIKRRNLEPIEANERPIREEFRQKYGMAAMAILNLPRFKKLLEIGDVLGDGLYSFEEYKVLKKEFGKQFITVAVYAPPELRYERLTKRKLVSSDTALRDRPATKEAAESRDYAELENLNKGATIAMADYTILNTKDLDFFKKQLEEIFNEIQS